MLFSSKHLFNHTLFNNTAANGKGTNSFNRSLIIDRGKAKAGLGLL